MKEVETMFKKKPIRMLPRQLFTALLFSLGLWLALGSDATLALADEPSEEALQLCVRLRRANRLPGSFRPGTTVKVRQACQRGETAIGTVGSFVEIEENTALIESNTESIEDNAYDVETNRLAIEQNVNAIVTNLEDINYNGDSIVEIQKRIIQHPFPTYDTAISSDSSAVAEFTSTCDNEDASDDCFKAYYMVATLWDQPLCQDAYSCNPNADNPVPDCSERETLCKDYIQDQISYYKEQNVIDDLSIFSDIFSIVSSVFGAVGDLIPGGQGGEGGGGDG